MNPVLSAAVLRKVSLRLIPFLFLLYVVNILDRVNVGFARLRMLDDLNMNEEVYAFGVGLFYIGYCIFEVPSNLILSRTGARRWIARILISWGLISCAMLAVEGKWSFYLLRLLLGFAEAGFFPGIILYLTYWFPARERAKAVSRFMIGSPMVTIVGGPVSGWIVQYMDQAGGLAGWQWLFLLEGAPAVLLGVAVYYYLTDRPADARWLEPEERDALVDVLATEEKARAQPHHGSLWRSLTAPRLWLLVLVYFAPSAGTACMGYYLPRFIQQKFSGMDEFHIGLLSAIPSLGAMVGMILVGLHSDHTGERRWHVALSAFVAAAGWVLSAWAPTPQLSLAAWTMAHIGMMSTLAPFWTMPTAYLSGTAAAGGIALINSFGNLGGLVGPILVGQSWKQSGSYTYGIISLGVIMFLGGLLALAVRTETASKPLAA